MSGTGTIIVVWESENIPEEGKKAICGQLYDCNGLGLGTEFVINEEPAVCRYPVVATDAYGHFVVAWLDDRSSNSILARLFDADGSAITDTFEINTIKISSVTRPSIAMDAAGYFIVAWDGDPDRASLDDIHARLFDPNGAPLGEPFSVNTTHDGPQRYPKVAMNDRGEFIIVWESQIDPDITERDIFGQRFNSFGEPIGGEFQINMYIEGDQRYPSVAISDDGRFITVWQSDDQDGSGYGIFGQMDSIVGSADLDSDGFVNFYDFCLLASQWRQEDNSFTLGLIDDNIINDWDLSAFCGQWLSTYR
jgi:hypothetical protein